MAKTKTKEKAGRPKAEIAELPKDWQKKLIELGRQGASDVELRCEIAKWRGSCSNDLWGRWLEDEQDFSETVAHARLLCEMFWEKSARQSKIGNGEGQIHPTAWKFFMQNKFGWKDKQELGGDQSAPVNIIINESGKGSRAD